VKLWDPGAQPERTSLAWTRTTLALISTGLLGVRAAPTTSGAVLAAAAVCAAVAVLSRRNQHRHDARPRLLTAGAPVVDPQSILLATASTVAIGMIDLLLTLSG